MLGFADELDDFLQSALTGGPEHERFNHSPKIERPRQYRVANAFFDWSRFAGQIGLVAGRGTFDDFCVHWELISRFDAQLHPGLQLLDRMDLLISLVVEHGCHFGRCFK